LQANGLPHGPAQGILLIAFNLNTTVDTTKYTKDTKFQRVVVTSAITRRVSSIPSVSSSLFVCFVYFVVPIAAFRFNDESRLQRSHGFLGFMNPGRWPGLV
jgi:hypothetical protein